MNYTFVDLIYELDIGKRIVTAKNIARTEDYLDEYYPRLRHVPGSVIIETMASSAGLLLFASTHYTSLAMLVMVEEAIFTHPVQPGDRMLVEVKLTALHDEAGRSEAVVRVKEKTVARARLVLGLFNIKTVTDPQMRDFFAALLNRTKKWMERSLARQKPTG